MRVRSWLRTTTTHALPSGTLALGLAWSFTALAQSPVVASSVHYFPGSATDAELPAGGTLVDRNDPSIIYGTGTQGGLINAGEVYALEGQPGEKLRSRLVYSFKADPDLGAPTGRLFQDATGALYGGAIAGGAHRNGGLFKLTPPATGRGEWTETILYSFPNRGVGYANFNVSGLVGDEHGHVYGTVFLGRGNVFEIRPDGSYHDLHDFEGPDGQGPTSPLTIGPDGVLYGVTGYGGTHPCQGFGCGTVYALTPGANGAMQFATVFSFDSGAGGQLPYGPVALDAAGAIYGTAFTKNESSLNSGGTVFKVVPASGAAPTTETVLYDFGFRMKPYNGVRFDPAGGIYGTYFGGLGKQVEYYLPPAASATQPYPTLVELLTTRDGGFVTDGVTVTANPFGHDVTVDDYASDAGHFYGGSVFRLRVKPTSAP